MLAQHFFAHQTSFIRGFVVLGEEWQGQGWGGVGYLNLWLPIFFLLHGVAERGCYFCVIFCYFGVVGHSNFRFYSEGLSWEVRTCYLDGFQNESHSWLNFYSASDRPDLPIRLFVGGKPPYGAKGQRGNGVLVVHRECSFLRLCLRGAVPKPEPSRYWTLPLMGTSNSEFGTHGGMRFGETVLLQR